MSQRPKRQRQNKSILVLMPNTLLSKIDAEVKRRQKEGDMVTRSAFIRDAVLQALKGS